MSYTVIANQTPSLKTSNYTNGEEIYTVGTNIYGGTNTYVSLAWQNTTSTYGHSTVVTNNSNPYFSSSIKIGSGTISWDSTNNCFHFSHGLYSDSFVSAKGANSSAGGTVSGVTKLSQLSDVQLGTLATNQVLSWNGSKWVNKAISTGLDETALAQYLTNNQYVTMPTGDGRYVKKAGDTMTGVLTANGGISITADKTLQWSRNTDYITMGFKSTSDGDADSYFYQTIGDNGNEYFKWQQAISGGSTAELMSLKSDALRFKGNVVLHAGNYTSTLDTRYVKKAGDTMTGALTVPSLAVSGSTATVSGNKVWHAGNDGSGSGLDADLLDGTHKTGLLTSVTSSSTTNLSVTVGGTTKSITDLYANYAVSAGNADTLDGRQGTSYAIAWGMNVNTDKEADDTTSTSITDFLTRLNYSGIFGNTFGAMRGSWYYVGNTQYNTGVGSLEMAGTAVLNMSMNANAGSTYKTLLFLEGPTGNMYSYVSQESGVARWSRYAKTSDNVYSATKLQTARSIWGQSFDGTAPVSGTLSGVTGIDFSTANAVIFDSYGNPCHTTTASTSYWGVKNTSGTAQFVVRASDGNVGIGTTSPSYKLHVAGTGYFSGALTTSSTITASGDISTTAGLIKITKNGNTTTIGSQNATWCHIYNSNRVGFIFNNKVCTTGGGSLGDTQYRWGGVYSTTGNFSRALTVSDLITANGGLTTSQYIQIGSARLMWDSEAGALYVLKSDGTACGFYATGFVSAKGANGDGRPGDLTDVDSLTFTPGTSNRNLYFNASGMRIITTNSSNWATGISVYNNANTTKLGDVCGAYGGENSFSYSYFGGSYNSPGMVILPSNKYVGIGTTSPTYKLHVSGTAYATGGFQNGSDIRYKHVLQDLALTVAQVAAAPSFLFRWTDGTADGVQAGSSAQYWQQVMPQVVTESAGRLSMQYDKAALAAAITIAREVETLEQRVDRLEKENYKLKKKVKELERRAA